jgi:hypothetical protein
MRYEAPVIELRVPLQAYMTAGVGSPQILSPHWHRSPAEDDARPATEADGGDG